MLTLDQTTLYYHFLSNSAPNGNNGEKFLSGINNWAASIPRNAKPASKATTTTTKATSGGSLLPPLTEATTRSASSVLTKNISISHKAPVNVKLEADDDAFNSIGGGLSDEDETNGIERDAAVASPLKGKKCVTSAVSNFFHFAFHLI
jgi:hypothetical protein